MAVAPHGLPEYNKSVPHGGDTALMFAARAGDLASARLLVAAGANVNDADAWGVSATMLAAHSGFGGSSVSAGQGREPECLHARFYGASRGGHAPRSTDGWRATRSRRRRKRAPACLDADSAAVKGLQLRSMLVGATPFWLAARFVDPAVMRLLVKHGADPLFVTPRRVSCRRSG